MLVLIYFDLFFYLIKKKVKNNKNFNQELIKELEINYLNINKMNLHN